MDAARDMVGRATVYLATGNAHKLAEFREMAEASGLGIEIRSARDLGGMPPVVEDAMSFEGNARKKAAALRAIAPPGAWILADDSGLCVDSLDGAPGVDSAYFAGPHGDSRANLAKLLRTMEETPRSERGAHFRCLLLLIGPDGREWTFEGRSYGRILEAPRGSGGFGYDPAFAPDGMACSMAELATGEKNALSHRGRAFAGLASFLRKAASMDDPGQENIP